MNDWRELANQRVMGSVPMEYELAIHFGIIKISHDMDSTLMKSRIKDMDIIYDVGQHLINQYGIESYLDITGTLDTQPQGTSITSMFYKNIERLLEAYKKNEFINYETILTTVNNQVLVPNLMIDSGLLLLSEETLRNQIPPHMEYSVVPWIKQRIYPQLRVIQGVQK